MDQLNKAAEEARKKSKRKNEMTYYEYLERLLLMNTDSYLYTIDEARKMLRIDRDKFVRLYIKTQKIPVTLLEGGKTMIRHSDLKEYLQKQQRFYVG